MKISSTLFSHVIEIGEEKVASVVVENGRLFRELVEGLHDCLDGGDDSFVFSENGKELAPEDVIDLVEVFAPVSLNRKTLVVALQKRMEKLALAPERRCETERLLGQLGAWIRQISLDIPHEVEIEGVAISSVVKAAGLSFAEDDISAANRLLDYMRLVREFVGDRLYVLVNSRVFFSDDELQGVLNICLLEKMRVLLVDGVERHMLRNEDRLLIDEDLCELATADDNMI